MYRPARCCDFETGCGDQIVKFRGRAKFCPTPGGITKPAANASVCGPKAPAAEFANDQRSSRLEHSGHFLNRPFRIPDKAERGHGAHKVKRRIVERQILRPSDDQAQLQAVVLGPPFGSRNHRRICVKAGHQAATTSDVEGKDSVATAHVEQCLAGH